MLCFIVIDEKNIFFNVVLVRAIDDILMTSEAKVYILFFYVRVPLYVFICLFILMDVIFSYIRYLFCHYDSFVREMRVSHYTNFIDCFYFRFGSCSGSMSIKNLICYASNNDLPHTHTI